MMNHILCTQHSRRRYALVSVLMLIFCMAYTNAYAATKKMNSPGFNPNTLKCVIESLVGEQNQCHQTWYSCTAEASFRCYNQYNELVGTGSCGFQHSFTGTMCRYKPMSLGGNCTIPENCDCSQLVDNPCMHGDCAAAQCNYESNPGGDIIHCSCSATIRSFIP